MSLVRRHLAHLLLVLTFVGWVHYPAWLSEWYSNLPEQYAWPASMSKPCEPRWGFWFW